jgi:hypothetical protein
MKKDRLYKDKAHIFKAPKRGTTAAVATNTAAPTSINNTVAVPTAATLVPPPTPQAPSTAYAVAPSTPAQPIMEQLNAVTELVMQSTVKKLDDDEKRKEREAKIDEKFDMLASSAIQANEKSNYAIGLGELAVEKSKYAVKRSDFAVEQTERFEARLQTEVLTLYS